jgi:hypothetical protein
MRSDLGTNPVIPRVYPVTSVERIAWTDQRDDLANRMDSGFARVDADIAS